MMSSDPVPPRQLAPISPPPRLVLFDLDDTLCDYAGARALRLRIAFSTGLARAAVGHEIDLDRLIADSLAIHPHGADHFSDLLRRYGVADEAVAEAARRWYQGNRFHGLELFADAVETIAAVRAALPNRRIGLITNGPTEVQRPKIELLNITPLVDFAIISEEFGAWKPDPAIFVEALRLGEASAAESVFIGDSAEHDVAGARAAGIRAIWVNRTGRPWPLAAPPPDHEVPDLAAVRRLLAAADTGPTAS